jgi:hypothetical protein
MAASRSRPGHRRGFARFAGGVAVLAALAIPATVRAQRGPDSEKIAISARPIVRFDPRDASRTRFGELTFRGGLVLTSPAKHFGGISSLRMAADGAHFLAVSDKGYWLRGRVAYRDGVPAGIEDGEMAPILGSDGSPLYRRRWFDTESLAEDGGTAYVGIEGVNAIVRLDVGKDGLHARGVPIPVPAGIKTLPRNRGLECLVTPPKGQPLAGTLIAISERGLDAEGNILGFLLGPGGGTFKIKRSNEFDISDCAVTPRGDLLLLERSFSWLGGLGMRIRRLPLAAVKPDALLDGPVLIAADMGYEIDNMEGLSVHQDADGALVLTLISDDNFFVLERTVLLQFTMP